MPGAVDDVHSVLSQAGIFAFTSYNEGFPNVLIEAMSVGLPVVAFDCEYGPSDIIRNGDNGILIPNGNIEQFAEAICNLIKGSEKRNRIGNSARNVLDEFNSEKIYTAWSNLINDIANKKKLSINNPRRG